MLSPCLNSPGSSRETCKSSLVQSTSLSRAYLFSSPSSPSSSCAASSTPASIIATSTSSRFALIPTSSLGQMYANVVVMTLLVFACGNAQECRSQCRPAPLAIALH